MVCLRVLLTSHKDAYDLVPTIISRLEIKLNSMVSSQVLTTYDYELYGLYMTHTGKSNPYQNLHSVKLLCYQ